MTVDDESWVKEWLSPLASLDLKSNRSTGRRTLLHRGVLIGAASAAAVATAVGIAAASGLDLFAGLSSADHGATAADSLPPKVLSSLGEIAGTIVPNSSRLVDELSSGRDVFVVATASNGICVVIVDGGIATAESCGNPLTQAEPVTIGTLDPDGPGGTPALSYGIAQDDVKSVSFPTGTGEETVPVTHNVWAWEGDSGALESLIVHFEDGSSMQLNH